MIGRRQRWGRRIERNPKRALEGNGTTWRAVDINESSVGHSIKDVHPRLQKSSSKKEYSQRSRLGEFYARGNQNESAVKKDRNGGHRSVLQGCKKDPAIKGGAEAKKK